MLTSNSEGFFTKSISTTFTKSEILTVGLRVERVSGTPTYELRVSKSPEVLWPPRWPLVRSGSEFPDRDQVDVHVIYLKTRDRTLCSVVDIKTKIPLSERHKVCWLNDYLRTLCWIHSYPWPADPKVPAQSAGSLTCHNSINITQEMPLIRSTPEVLTSP